MVNLFIGAVSMRSLAIASVAFGLTGLSACAPIEAKPTVERQAASSAPAFSNLPEICVEAVRAGLACAIPVDGAGAPVRSRMTCVADQRPGGSSDSICTGLANAPAPAVAEMRRTLLDRLCLERTDSGRCERWSEGRPFDGLDLGALDHPWCRRWENTEQDCLKDASGALHCTPWTAADRQRGISTQREYRCTDWRVPAWCDEWTDGIRRLSRAEERTGLVPTASIDPSPLKFVRCLKLRGKP